MGDFKNWWKNRVERNKQPIEKLNFLERWLHGLPASLQLLIVVVFLGGAIIVILTVGYQKIDQYLNPKPELSVLIQPEQIEYEIIIKKTVQSMLLTCPKLERWGEVYAYVSNEPLYYQKDWWGWEYYIEISRKEGKPNEYVRVSLSGQPGIDIQAVPVQQLCTVRTDDNSNILVPFQ